MGSMTCVASPPAIFGCACRIPSKIHSTPNPVRSSHRARASAGSPAVAPPVPGGRGGPPGTCRRPEQPEEHEHEEGDGALVQQGRPKRGDQRRVAGAQA